MGYSLVITADRQVAAEFETVAAVTGARVEVSPLATPELVAGAARVFVDAGSPECAVEHREVVVVVLGTAGPAQWGLAARLAAATIVELPLHRALLAELVGVRSEPRGVMVAIAPAVGGVGASTLAVALGTHAAKCGLTTVVVDCDTAAGGLDILAGAEGQPGARWSRTAGATDAAGALVRIDGIDLLSGDARTPRELADDDVAAIEVLRQGYDVVVLDLPDAASAVSRRLMSMCEYVAIATVNSVRATAVTAAALALPVPGERGIVVRMLPGARLDAMGVAQSLDAPLWATLPTDSRVVEQVEQGLGPGSINLGGYTRSLAHLAGRVLAGVQSRAA